MLNYALREMSRRRGRSIINMLGYGASVLIFSVLVSLLAGSKKAVQQVLTSTGTHFIAFQPGCCDFPTVKDVDNEGFWANGSRSRLFSSDVLGRIQGLESVADASPFLLFKMKRAKDAENGSIFIGGFDPSNTLSVANTSCSASDIVDGRFLLAKDTAAVILEQSFAVSQKLHVGDSLSVSGAVFPVVGLINPGIRPAKADAYFVYSTAKKLISSHTWLPLENETNIVLVESASAFAHGQAMEDVRQIIGDLGLISTYGCYQSAASAMTLQQRSIVGLLVLILLFVFFSSFRTQSALLMERKREMEILHAIGWTRGLIMKLIFSESFVQAICGSLAGGAVAFILVFLFPVKAVLGVETVHLTQLLRVILFGTSLSAVAGMLAAMISAYHTTAFVNPSELRLV